MGLTLATIVELDAKLFDKLGEAKFYQIEELGENRLYESTTPNIQEHDITNYILDVAGDFPTVYHSPDTFKAAFHRWWRVNVFRWARMYETMAREYDPISNYDRTEEWTDTVNGTAQESGRNSTTANSTSNLTGNAERTQKTAAFDSNTMVGRESHIEQSTNTAKDSSNTSGTATRNSTNTQNSIRKGRAYGNIGVTTTQEMLQAEREVLKFELLEIISNEYKKRFCILVY